MRKSPLGDCGQELPRGGVGLTAGTDIDLAVHEVICKHLSRSMAQKVTAGSLATLMSVLNLRVRQADMQVCWFGGSGVGVS